jgi:hypothetical protein
LWLFWYLDEYQKYGINLKGLNRKDIFYDESVKLIVYNGSNEKE